ncbi:hypothetical protein K3495_g6468 [Podosphaera aphanis]|nr:hypothetical protein K3495_g6468 [Podosphaera aphanis]
MQTTDETVTTLRSTSRPQPQRHRTDVRLFVRIPEGDKLRDLSAYAIQSHLKAKLGIEGRLLTNVQPTKTGFALCPKDGDTAKLKETISKANFFGDAQVEPASPWTSYRIKNVPRKFGTITDKLTYCLQPVTAAAMHDAHSAAAGVAPVVISLSRDNEADPSSPSVERANVTCTGVAAHEIALNEAYSVSADVILIQEPYILKERARRITKRHPSYITFSPIDDWTSTRPRVLSYIRKDAPFLVDQGYTTQSGDLLLLLLESLSRKKLQIMNIYNEPQGSSGGPPSHLYTLSPSISAENSYRWATSTYTIPIGNHLGPAASHRALNNEATHIQGNVLDLAFGSCSLIAKSHCTVASHLNTTSDHASLLTMVDWIEHNAPQRKLRPDTLDSALFNCLLFISINRVAPLPPSPNSDSLDTLALGLTEAKWLAYSGSTRRTLGHGKGNPWWDKSCKTVRQRYKSITKVHHTEEDFIEARKEYHKTIKKAKNKIFSAQVSKASTARDIFNISKWHKSTGFYNSPPLKDPRFQDKAPATTLAEKREIFAANLLVNPAEAGDIPLDAPSVSVRTLPFPPLSPQEVRDTLLKADNTASGLDEIPTAILRCAWRLVADLVLSIFSGCISLGYHHYCFRQAILIIIQKPNKSDLSSPRAYRPIALLSVLGKGLERLLAKRISLITIRHKILATQQFGALPGRSAADLTTCLTHDVERALSEGRSASMLTLDVKGAFDAVLPGRLVRRTREQGWPDYLVRWVGSFATDRSVHIKLDGETGPPQQVDCGLPQGSPVSPILFMLYISPLFRLGNIHRRFGYADDVAILETRNSLQENCTSLTEALKEALAWGREEEITFDPNKSELQLFSRRRVDKDPSSTPVIEFEQFSVAEDATGLYTRWLGVYFDKKITFKWHVNIFASKALKVANALRSLGNTSRGCNPNLLRQATIACILPIAYYGAENWWPGRYRTTLSQIVSMAIYLYCVKWLSLVPGPSCLSIERPQLQFSTVKPDYFPRLSSWTQNSANLPYAFTAWIQDILSVEGQFGPYCTVVASPVSLAGPSAYQKQNSWTPSY